MRRPIVAPHERGAALLTVLLLVAVMATVSATALDRLTLATRVAGNAQTVSQARHWLGMAEQLTAVRLEDMLAAGADRTVSGAWQGAPRQIRLPDSATLTMRVVDGGNCFNLNSLVARTGEGLEIVRPAAVEQFTALMTSLGVDPTQATRIAAAVTDWVDSDSMPVPAGVEDGQGRMVANRPMADESELGRVSGVTPEIAAMLQPWVCALPSHDASPVNVNTLLPEQAPLLAMLLPGKLTADRARAALAERPAGGFASAEQFWRSPALSDLKVAGEAATQVRVRSAFFRLDASVRKDGLSLGQTALLGERDGRVQVLRRTWSNGT